MRIQRRQAADEQRRRRVGGERDAACQARAGVVGAGHPVDEGAHDRNPAEHRQVRHDGHPQRAFHGQHDRRSITDDPTDLGGADKGRNRWNRRENQRVGEVHVADAFLFVATYFSPFLIGVGEESHDMMNHSQSLLCYCHRPPTERLRASGQVSKGLNTCATLCRSIERTALQKAQALEQIALSAQLVIAFGDLIGRLAPGASPARGFCVK
ncbi:hypothetical protein EMIT0162MI3_20333 [Pseudomonas chlororaphis]